VGNRSRRSDREPPQTRAGNTAPPPSRRPQAAAPGSGEQGEAAPSRYRAPRRRLPRFHSLLRALLPTLLVTIIVACVRDAVVGRFDLLERLSAAFYDYTQSRLAGEEERKAAAAAGPDRDPYPVLIVNLDDIPTEASSVSGKPETSRPALQRLITKLAALRPAAIGVDVDMSPEVEFVSGNEGVSRITYIDPILDPSLLWQCRDLSEKGVPVYLGIHRTLALPPDDWLGDGHYRSLAANLAVPKVGQKALWRWTPSGQKQDSFRSLSLALAERFPQEMARVRPGALWRWAVCQDRGERGHPEVGERFLVNYSGLTRMREKAVPYRDVLSSRVPEERLRTSSGDSKVVLLGYLQPRTTEDFFSVPGHRESVPGVLLHACAVDSLVRQPVYQLTLPGRLALDLLPACLGVAAVMGLAWRLRGIPPEDAVARKRGWTLVSLVICFSLAFGFVSRHHVAWDEFPFVFLGALWHPDIEYLATGALRPFSTGLRSFLRAGAAGKSSQGGGP